MLIFAKKIPYTERGPKMDIMLYVSFGMIWLMMTGVLGSMALDAWTYNHRQLRKLRAGRLALARKRKQQELDAVFKYYKF
jgi:hypothetical protein